MQEERQKTILSTLFGSGFFLFRRGYLASRIVLVSVVLFSVLFVFSSFSSFRRHEFHSSLAELHYNPASKSLEVSLRVFTDDFGTALTKANNRTITIDESAPLDPLIKQYLSKNFALTDARNVRKPITWVGKEITVDVTWLYFEIPLTEDMNGMKLQNSVLFESFDNQVNIVNVTYKTQKKTYLYKPDQATQLMQW